jgi:hypothetical protein
MKTLTYILITFAFAFSCFGLWAPLNVLGSLSPQSSQALPGFTRLLVESRMFLLFLPIPVLLYCVYRILRRGNSQESTATAFVACTMSLLSAVFFPVLLGLVLPCAVLMEQIWSR